MKKEQIKATDRIKESQDEIRSYMTLCEEEIKKACYQEEKASSLILKAAIQRIISLSISAINHSNELLTSILSLFDKYCLHIINLNNEYVETLKKDRKTIEGLKDDDAIKGVAFAQRLSHRMTENMIENATCSYDNMILSCYLLCLFALQCLYLSLRYYEQEKNKKFFKVLKDLGSELIDSIAIVSFLRKLIIITTEISNVFDEQAIQEEFFERVDNPLQVFEKQIDDLETINNMLMSFINVVVNAIKEHEELMQKNVDELEEEFNRKFIRKDDCETNKRK